MSWRCTLEGNLHKEFVGIDKRVDNQKGKATKGKGPVIELSLLGDKKGNRTTRDKGKQLLGTQRIQKNMFLWKPREETIPRRVWLRLSQIPKIQMTIILDCKDFVTL